MIVITFLIWLIPKIPRLRMYMASRRQKTMFTVSMALTALFAWLLIIGYDAIQLRDQLSWEYTQLRLAGEYESAEIVEEQAIAAIHALYPIVFGFFLVFLAWGISVAMSLAELKRLHDDHGVE